MHVQFSLTLLDHRTNFVVWAPHQYLMVVRLLVHGVLTCKLESCMGMGTVEEPW